MHLPLRFLLALGARCLAGLAPTIAAAQVTAHGPMHGLSHDSAASMGVHGMLVVGPTADGRAVLSHLPLYRAPHDRQLLLAVRLRTGPDGATAAAVLRRACRRLCTFEPERLPLARLAGADAAVRVRFRGTLYAGHFERGGTVARRDVEVEVEQVLVSETLHAGAPVSAGASSTDTPSADTPSAATPTPQRYDAHLFALGDRWYLAHRIGAAPSFDQIVELAPATAAALPAAHRTGTRSGALAATILREAHADGTTSTGARAAATKHAGARGSVAHRPLRAGERVRLPLPPHGAAGTAVDTVSLRVARTLYLEFDDLRAPATAAASPTP